MICVLQKQIIYLYSDVYSFWTVDDSSVHDSSMDLSSTCTLVNISYFVYNRFLSYFVYNRFLSYFVYNRFLSYFVYNRFLNYFVYNRFLNYNYRFLLNY
jgi:hypothetical protein